MHILIVEDEPLLVKHLVKLLADVEPAAQVAGSTNSIASTVAWLSTHEKPDLILMDIELADGQSFEVFEKMEVKSPVIFTTAYDEYALKAFKVSSIDYLLKPVNISELQQAIKKVQEVVLRKKRSQQGAVLQSANNFNPLKKLILTTVDGYYPVKLQEIAYCKANDSYTHFYMQNGKHYIASKSLKEFEEVLSGYNFFRIHKSFLINMDHIELVNKESGGISVIMDNQDTLPVAFRKKEEFIEKLRTM